MKIVLDDGTEIPLAAIRVLDYRLTDKLIFTVDSFMTEADNQHLFNAAKSIFPDNDIMVMRDGIELEVFRGET
jgi:hypothetical protein